MADFIRCDQQPKKFETAKSLPQLTSLVRREAVADLKQAGFTIVPIYRIPK